MQTCPCVFKCIFIPKCVWLFSEYVNIYQCVKGDWVCVSARVQMCIRLENQLFEMQLSERERLVVPGTCTPEKEGGVTWR